MYALIFALVFVCVTINLYVWQPQSPMKACTTDQLYNIEAETCLTSCSGWPNLLNIQSNSCLNVTSYCDGNS